MSSRYLEITYRRGKPFAAYLYLPRKSEDHTAKVQPTPDGLLIDYTADGRAIGIEIPSPSQLSLGAINRALATTGQPAATADELSPFALS